MSISDGYTATEQMDTSIDADDYPDTDLDLNLDEEEEEEIERVVADLCDRTMSVEAAAVFAGQDPGIVEQYLRYAQGTTFGQEEEEEEQEGGPYAAAPQEDSQTADRYAWALAAELRDEVWQEFVETLGDEQDLADESDAELQAAIAAAKDTLLRQAYDNILAEQSLLKNGS